MPLLMPLAVDFCRTDPDETEWRTSSDLRKAHGTG